MGGDSGEAFGLAGGFECRFANPAICRPPFGVAVQPSQENAMSTTTPAVSALAIDAEIKEFKSAITDMDSLSQGGFSKISSIARLALLSLEGPKRPREDEDISNVLKAIWSIADDIENCINCRAEEVGANFIDDRLNRRRTEASAASMADGGAA
jgi:hypothetical protein